MQIECTGRQTRISKKLRQMAETGSTRIGKILGKAARSHIVLSSEKHRHIAEVELKTRTSRLVALCESAIGMEVALREALSKAENQAVRYKAKRRTQKRQPKPEKALEQGLEPTKAAPAAGQLGLQNGSRITAEKPSRNHRRPPTAAGLHVLRSPTPIPLEPMTVAEAVKEAEFRDHDVFVFRDNEGNVNVLHRQQDGKMELIVAPLEQA